MPYDMASLLASLGLGAGAGAQFGANGMQAGGMQGGGMQGWMGPQGTTQSSMPGGGAMPQLQGSAPSSPAAGGQGLMSSGMMGPLSAAAAMMQASGPSRTPVGFGQVAGAGLQGMMGGMQADQANSMLAQQHDNLGRIADKLGQPPATGAAPMPGTMGQGGTAMPPPQGAPAMPQLPPGMMPGGQSAMPSAMPTGMPPMQGAAQGMPQMQALAQNPMLMMMMRKQQGLA